MKDQSVLDIQLLGAFRLRYQNQEIRQGLTSRLESLLAYLLLHRDAPIPRQRLAFLFWPDASEKQAHTNLRNLLYKLRSVLPDADRYLSIEQSTLHWQTSLSFNLDVDKFSSQAGNTTSMPGLQEAIRIYAGDFLPDCFDDWTYSFRESLRQTYLDTLEKLFLLLAESGRPREALPYAQTLLRQDPTREETYCHLMRLHAQCGDRASVARVYKTCITVLDRELGVKPGKATQDAYRHSIAQEIDWSSTETADILSQEQSRHNLPVSLTRLIGRDQELVRVKDLLSRNRLVTLVGPGGIGKTRLALAAAREIVSGYRDGVFLVDLVPVIDSETVNLAIADALQASDEIRSSGLEGLKDHLSGQSLLLLLDNCEHLVEEVGSICSALLSACPQLTILVTSREALKIYGETLWEVPALLTPVAVENPDPSHGAVLTRVLRSNESVMLFIDRATSALPTFKANDESLFSIAEICRCLDGMPLAIEMAAARVKTFSTQQIVQRLDHAIDLLQHPDLKSYHRHHTMEAVMLWSYSLLKPAECKLFARLGIFSGSFSFQAVEEICHGDGIQKQEILELIASLVDKSLISTLPTLPEARFKLHEIIRQYAHQQLNDSDRVKYWKDRHMNYFVSLAEEAEPKIRGSEQLEWLNRLELEQENLRGALRYALEYEIDTVDQVHDIESAARLVGALWMFWFIRGRFSEGRRWAEQVLVSRERMDRTSPALGKLLYTAASFCFFQGDYYQAEELSLESLHICRAANDLFGEAISFHHLGILAMLQGNLAPAHNQLHKGLELAISLGDAWLISVLQGDLADLADHEGDQHGRLDWNRQSLETGRQVGNKFSILYDLLNLAEMAIESGDTRQAALLAEESLDLSREIGERRGISFALHHLGCIAMHEEAYRQADELLKQSLQVIWVTRDRGSILGYLIDLADNATREGKFEFAARLLAACEAAKMNFPAGYGFVNQSTYERLVETIPMHLESGTFTALWTLGRLMNLEQAVGYALKDHPQKTHK